jgi:hypothetical protein
VPSTKPSSVDTKVTDVALKPVGTAAPTGAGGSEVAAMAGVVGVALGLCDAGGLEPIGVAEVEP